jgi:hypothetical protein
MKLHERTRVLDEPALRSPDLFWALAPLCLLGAVALVARRADLGAVTWLPWTATWLVILVVRLVDTFGRIPLFFRGAPPRLTWLDAVVALYLIVWGLGLARRALPPLPFLMAFPVLRLSRWARGRSASWPGSVVVLERSAFGVARWLPLALSGVVGAIAATAPASSGSEGVSYVQACLAALAATFLADRVSRVGMIDLEASGRVVLRIHGTALVVTDGRAHGADVVLETAVGPVRVTWPGVTGLRGVEFARGLAALVRRGDP